MTELGYDEETIATYLSDGVVEGADD